MRKIGATFKKEYILTFDAAKDGVGKTDTINKIIYKPANYKRVRSFTYSLVCYKIELLTYNLIRTFNFMTLNTLSNENQLKSSRLDAIDKLISKFEPPNKDIQNEAYKRLAAEYHVKSLQQSKIDTIEYIIKELNILDEKEINYISHNLRWGLKLEWKYNQNNLLKNADTKEVLDFIKILRETNLSRIHPLKDYINNDYLAKETIEGKKDFETTNRLGELTIGLQSLYDDFQRIDSTQAKERFKYFINQNTRNNCDKTIVVMNNRIEQENGDTRDIKLIALNGTLTYVETSPCPIKFKIIDEDVYIVSDEIIPSLINKIPFNENIDAIYKKFPPLQKPSVDIDFKRHFQLLKEIKNVLLKERLYTKFDLYGSKKPCKICQKATRGKNKASCDYCFNMINNISTEISKPIATLKSALEINTKKDFKKEKERQKKYCNKLLKEYYPNQDNKIGIQNYLNYLTT